MAESPKKHMDVQAPGKAAPSATSRPVIIGHGPMMTDPMVQKEKSADLPEAAPPKAPSAAHKVIEPEGPTLGSLQKKVEEKPAGEPKAEVSKTDQPAEPPTPEAKEEAEPEPKEEPEKPAETQESEASPESSEGAAIQAVADQTADKKKETEAAKAEADRQVRLDQLVAEKTYFVPLSVAHHRKARRGGLVAVMLLVLLAAGAGTAYYLGLFNF